MKRFGQFILLIHLTVLPVWLVAQATGDSATQPVLINNEVSQSALPRCLPPKITLGDVVEVTSTGYANGQPVGLHKVTVEQKLVELKATCNADNKLVDGSGKQIIFYHLKGCWGNPPRNYQEILQKQRDEINRLKQQYTVIEMTCNPSGTPVS